MMALGIILGTWMGVEASRCWASEPDAFQFFEEEAKVVGVSKKSESIKNVPMSVTVVSQEELNRWNVHSFNELLGRVPGFSFYDTDFYGQTSINTRGIAGQLWRTRFGFELMNIPDFGHFIFSPYFYKNIEVARGPAGLTWGGSAEAGLFNLNLRDDLNGYETHVEVGNNDRQAYDVLYGKKFEKEGDGYFVGLHTEKQDPATRTQDGKSWKENGINPSYQVLAKIKDQRFKFLAFNDHEDHVIPISWFNDGNTLGDALKSKNGPFHDEFETNAMRGEYHLINEDKNNFYFYGETYKKQWFITGMAIDTQRRTAGGFSGETNLLHDKLNLNAGGELSAQETTTDPSFNSSLAVANGIDWYKDQTGPSRMTFNNLYMQGRYQFLDRWQAVLGGRMDHQIHALVNPYLLSPRAGLIFSPKNNLTLKYLYNNTARRPTGNEARGAAPGIGPEYLTAHELIAMYDYSDKLKLNATLFHQVLEKVINDFGSGGNMNAYNNGGGISSDGLEWGVNYLPVKKVTMYWNGNLTRARVDSAVRDGVDKTTAHISNGQPVNSPLASSFLGCEVPLTSYFRFNVDLRTIYRIAYLAGTEDAYATVNLVDVSMRTKKFFNNSLSFSLACMNVADNKRLVPAFGEHVGSLGTMSPESRRAYASAILNF